MTEQAFMISSEVVNRRKIRNSFTQKSKDYDPGCSSTCSRDTLKFRTQNCNRKVGLQQKMPSI